jgi:hypothetical protein
MRDPKTRGGGGTEHTDHIGETRNAYKILVLKPEGKKPLWTLGIDRGLKLKLILEIQNEEWI